MRSGDPNAGLPRADDRAAILDDVTSDALLQSLRAAVEAAPDDVALRVHYAQLLAEGGQRDEAVRQAAAVLQCDPGHVAAMALLTGGAKPDPSTDEIASEPAAPLSEDDMLRRLDAELSDLAPPMFVDGGADPSTDGAYDVEQVGIRLADVGGMVEVKARLEASVLAPLRNPELVKLYGKSLRGGLLLYGPPGCGKTFIARAIAGEIDAKFISVSLADVLDM
jgi:SpoVK/Ycf46/Vps4 family AAA+-type ATPase